MATVILSHRVKDYISWKALYDSDKGRRDSAGVTEIAVGENADDPGMVHIVFQVADPSAMRAMMNDPELHKTMEAGGVISQPEVIIIN